MPTKSKALVMRERDGLRGEVPSRMEGRKDVVYGEYLKTLDPRHNMELQVCSGIHSDVRFQEFLDRISQTRYDRISLQSIAKACNIDLIEFQQWWNKGKTQVAIAHAQQHSVDIVKDMVEDAKSKKDVCDRCDGLRFVKAPSGLDDLEIPGYQEVGEGEYIRTCPKCLEGKINKPGDSHARDRILEMTGIIQKGRGNGITLVQNFGGASLASAVTNLDDLMTIDISSES